MSDAERFNLPMWLVLVRKWSYSSPSRAIRVRGFDWVQVQHLQVLSTIGYIHEATRVMESKSGTQAQPEHWLSISGKVWEGLLHLKLLEALFRSLGGAESVDNTFGSLVVIISNAWKTLGFESWIGRALRLIAYVVFSLLLFKVFRIQKERCSYNWQRIQRSRSRGGGSRKSSSASFPRRFVIISAGKTTTHSWPTQTKQEDTPTASRYSSTMPRISGRWGFCGGHMYYSGQATKVYY